MGKNITKKSISVERIVRGSSGFTSLEVALSLIILLILIAFASHIYMNYIGKAKATIAESVLNDAGKRLDEYQVDHGAYPANIDFIKCVDGQGQKVFFSHLCSQMKDEFYSVESYSPSDTGYTLIVRAKDKKHTLITLTDGEVTIQGN
jgi:type II secretory pathway pseudopilin PulG